MRALAATATKGWGAGRKLAWQRNAVASVTCRGNATSIDLQCDVCVVLFFHFECLLLFMLLLLFWLFSCLLLASIAMCVSACVCVRCGTACTHVRAM